MKIWMGYYCPVILSTWFTYLYKDMRSTSLRYTNRYANKVVTCYWSGHKFLIIGSRQSPAVKLNLYVRINNAKSIFLCPPVKNRNFLWSGLLGVVMYPSTTIAARVQRLLTILVRYATREIAVHGQNLIGHRCVIDRGGVTGWGCVHTSSGRAVGE